MGITIEAIPFADLPENEAFIFLEGPDGWSSDLVRRVLVKSSPDTFHTLGDGGGTRCQNLSTPVLKLRVYTSLMEPVPAP